MIEPKINQIVDGAVARVAHKRAALVPIVGVVVQKDHQNARNAALQTVFVHKKEGAECTTARQKTRLQKNRHVLW